MERTEIKRNFKKLRLYKKYINAAKNIIEKAAVDKWNCERIGRGLQLAEDLEEMISFVEITASQLKSPLLLRKGVSRIESMLYLLQRITQEFIENDVVLNFVKHFN